MVGFIVGKGACLNDLCGAKSPTLIYEAIFQAIILKEE